MKWNFGLIFVTSSAQTNNLMRILILTLFLIINPGINAQNLTEKQWTGKEKAVLINDWNEYGDALLRKDWQAVADKIYPGLFQLSSKEDIIRAMENGLNNLEYRTEMLPAGNMYIFPDYLERDGKKYALISYTDNLSIIFNRKPDENDITFEGRMDYIYHKFKKKYPAGQLIRGSEKNVFHLRIPKYMLAIYMPGQQSYTFIDFSDHPQKLAMLEQIFDKEIIDYFLTKISAKP